MNLRTQQPQKQVDEDDIYVKQQLEAILLEIRKEKELANQQLLHLQSKIAEYQQIHDQSARAQEHKRERSQQQQIIYANLRETLQQANIDPNQVLDPQYQPGEESRFRQLGDKEVLRIQKIIIEKLVTKLKAQS